MRCYFLWVVRCLNALNPYAMDQGKVLLAEYNVYGLTNFKWMVTPRVLDPFTRDLNITNYNTSDLDGH